MRIRPATEADADAVTEIVRAAGVDAWASFLGAERVDAAQRGARHPANLVAEDEDGVIATVAWNAETGEILRLYTHPRAQGRGAGAALLVRACDELREAGRTEAWLNTEERSEAARRFYESQGWLQDGPPRVRDWHGTRLVEPRYVKPL